MLKSQLRLQIMPNYTLLKGSLILLQGCKLKLFSLMIHFKSLTNLLNARFVFNFVVEKNEKLPGDQSENLYTLNLRW